MDNVQIRYFDSIVTPWRELVELVALHPIAPNPDSNKLSVAAEGLAISLRHFKERHPGSPVANVWISDRIVDWADSVKHSTETGRKKAGRDYSEKTIACFVTPAYEFLNDTFRFIRNEITCVYPLATGENAGVEFSAINEIWKAVKAYGIALGLDVSMFGPKESSYGFLPVAVAFSIPEYAVYTKEVRLKFFTKVGEAYAPFSPPEVRFVVLGKEHLESDLSKFDWPTTQAGF